MAYRKSRTRNLGPETWDPYIGPWTQNPLSGTLDLGTLYDQKGRGTWDPPGKTGDLKPQIFQEVCGTRNPWSGKWDVNE